MLLIDDALRGGGFRGVDDVRSVGQLDFRRMGGRSVKEDAVTGESVAPGAAAVAKVPV
jgi:hypothetical protein